MKTVESCVKERGVKSEIKELEMFQQRETELERVRGSC